MNEQDKRGFVAGVARKLIAEGRIIEAGWRSFEIAVIPVTAGRVQRIESRKAFFAGAQHLWAAMLSSMDPDSEPTDQDEHRMEMIHNELLGFVQELEAEIARRNS